MVEKRKTTEMAQIGPSFHPNCSHVPSLRRHGPRRGLRSPPAMVDALRHCHCHSIHCSHTHLMTYASVFEWLNLGEASFCVISRPLFASLEDRFEPYEHRRADSFTSPTLDSALRQDRTSLTPSLPLPFRIHIIPGICVPSAFHAQPALKSINTGHLPHLSGDPVLVETYSSAPSYSVLPLLSTHSLLRHVG
ncbi:hypothetical protein PENSPDRAFT_232136 [Peniophora sp. CONT]|nr:hypothetical protein PENSPDRAFT_232136 [Peniophora sp. CONT]